MNTALSAPSLTMEEARKVLHALHMEVVPALMQAVDETGCVPVKTVFLSPELLCIASKLTAVHKLDVCDETYICSITVALCQNLEGTKIQWQKVSSLPQFNFKVNFSFS